MAEWRKFDTWAEVVVAAANNERLGYHAPLDIHPVSIQVTKIFKNGKLRVRPLTNQAYPFTADKGHLDRFRRRA